MLLWRTDSFNLVPYSICFGSVWKVLKEIMAAAVSGSVQKNNERCVIALIPSSIVYPSSFLLTVFLNLMNFDRNRFS